MVSDRKRRRVHRERACMNGGCIHFDRFCTSEDENQEEMKSVKTEFIKEDREKMGDPEPCRIKHTEDTEQQTGWCLLFILH